MLEGKQVQLTLLIGVNLSVWKSSDLSKRRVRGGKKGANQLTMDQELTPESALALVQPFFSNEWSKIGPKDVTLRIIA